jgi:hypothetical protein
LKAERFINWKLRRTQAVAWLSNVNYTATEAEFAA